jgi:hypothetical protein
MAAPASDSTSRASFRSILSARGPSIVGCLLALLTVIVPLAAIDAASEDAPEVRVIAIRGRPTVLIADGDARVLILNTGDRERLRSALGRLGRPWEPDVQLLIAPADDDAAVGLWEALERSEPQQVIVTGLPGAAPLWQAIDNECRQRGITIRYLAGSVTVELGRLTLTVFGAEEGNAGAGVVVRRGAANALIAFDTALPNVSAQVLVTGADADAARADLIVTTDSATRRGADCDGNGDDPHLRRYAARAGRGAG